MKMFLVVALALLVGLLIWISSDMKDPMQECQRTYSHDVCFQMLNR